MEIFVRKVTKGNHVSRVNNDNQKRTGNQCSKINHVNKFNTNKNRNNDNHRKICDQNNHSKNITLVAIVTTLTSKSW